MANPMNKQINRRDALRGMVSIGGVMVALPAMTMLAGCADTPPQIEDKMAVISAVADRVIPKTDTPGAVDAGVPAYIAAVFANHFTADQQQAFADGLGVFDDMAGDKEVASFASASDDLKDAILSDLDKNDNATWRSIREMTIFGYYTSSAGPEELSYEELPGRYTGCVPMADVGRAWLDRGV